MKLSMCYLALFFVCILGTAPVVAQDEDCWDYATLPHLVGGVDTPGTAMEVIVAGDYAYVADGEAGLQVIDITVASSPIIVGGLDTPGNATDLCIAEKLLYLACGGAGIYVVDVSDPLLPKYVGSVDTPNFAGEIAVSADIAYVADGDAVLVIDVSDPSLPQIVHSVDIEDANGVTVHGNYAYVAAGWWSPYWDLVGGYFYMLDISVPENPRIAGSIESAVCYNSTVIDGDRAFVSYNLAGDMGDPPGDGGVHAIDISEPNSLRILGSEGLGDSYGIVVAGRYAYIASESTGITNRGLSVVNISDPFSSQAMDLLGSIITPGDAEGVAFANAYAFVADGDAGLQVIDFSVPMPHAPASVYTPDEANGITVADGYAYLANWHSGLQVIDIEDPDNPRIVGSVDTPGNNHDLAVSRSYAYVADGFSGLQIIDIANPEKPQLRASVATPGEAWSVAVSGSYAYVAAGSADLQVIDVTMLGPQNPRIIASLSMSGRAYDVAVSGNYAYVATIDSYWGPGSLQVIGIADPAHPQLIGSVALTDNAYGLAVSGGYAYVANSESGLQVIDVSDPLHPMVVGSADTPGRAWRVDVDVASSYAYVADGASGLQVIDISNPEDPHLVGGTGTPGYALDLAVASNGIVVIADNKSGVQILPQQCEYGIRVEDDHEYTGLDDGVPQPGQRFAVFPNPFNPRTVISFTLATGQHTEIAVHDLSGRRVDLLADRSYAAGTHSVVWNGRDTQGRAMPSGTYIVRLETESGVKTKKVSLVR